MEEEKSIEQSLIEDCARQIRDNIDTDIMNGWTGATYKAQRNANGVVPGNFWYDEDGDQHLVFDGSGWITTEEAVDSYDGVSDGIPLTNSKGDVVTTDSSGMALIEPSVQFNPAVCSPFEICVSDSNGDKIVSLDTKSKEMTFGDNYSPSEAAVEFWKVVSELYGGVLTNPEQVEVDPITAYERAMKGIN